MGHDSFHPPLAVAINYLAHLYKNGANYSVINTMRSALSSRLGLYDGKVFGQHPLVVRLLRGVFNTRPSQARYAFSWDVSLVLNYLRQLSPVRDLPLKDLTIKLCMLFALVTGQRCQTLHLLDLDHLSKGQDYVFHFAEPLKHSRPNKPAPVVRLRAFPPDRRLCIITVLKEYICRTASLRGAHTKLLLSYIKPYRPISRASISRWVKVCLVKAGIDINIFSAHSTRMASTSKAFAEVSLKTVLESAGWASAGTFQKFYKRDFHKSFANAVLH